MVHQYEQGHSVPLTALGSWFDAE